MTTPWRVNWNPDEVCEPGTAEARFIVADVNDEDDRLSVSTAYHDLEADEPDDALVEILVEQDRQTASAVVKVADLLAALRMAKVIE